LVRPGAPLPRMLHSQVAFGLLAASAAGRVLNRVANFVVSSEEEIDGFPRWRWVLSAFTQVVIFPGILLLALLFPETAWIDASQWLAQPASAAGVYARWYVYALFASQTRDMFPMPPESSMTMKVHHWVVVVACVLALYAPSGFGLFVAGTFALELGSMTFNLRKLYSTSSAVAALYQTTMFCSNVAALLGGLFMLRMKDIPIWMKALYFAADVGVCIGRQLHALKDAGVLGKNHNADAPADGGSKEGEAYARVRRRR